MKLKEIELQLDEAITVASLMLQEAKDRKEAITDVWMGQVVTDVSLFLRVANGYKEAITDAPNISGADHQVSAKGSNRV